MALFIGDIAPDFEAETTQGKIHFHKWINHLWVILFSHPKNFTPVCTSELGYIASLKPELDERGVKIIGISVDTLESHRAWTKDINQTQGCSLNFPLIADPEHKVSKLYDMIHPNTDKNVTIRSIFVIGADKRIKLSMSYPPSTGRNFDEVLRVIDSLQLTARYQVETPANWKQGEDVSIASSMSDEAAKVEFPDGWDAPKPYLRIVPQPLD